MQYLTRLIKKTFIISFYLISPILSGAGTPEVLIVSGTCQVSMPGRLYIFIVDEKQFRIPMQGNQSQVFDISVSSPGAKLIPFSFYISAGSYGLRCFLDTNGNGKLDRGLFGPSEPWGMSWQVKRSFGIPSFNDIGFQVDQNCKCPTIILE